MPALVFKLRDDLRLTRAANWVRFLNLTDDVYEHAERYYKVLTGSPAPSLTGPLGQALLKALEVVLRQLTELTAAAPRLAMDNGNVALLSQLAERVATYTPVARKGKRPIRPALPNLFNYFQIDLPDTLDESVAQRLLQLLGSFLTTRRFPFGITVPPLFDFVYLKPDPVPLGPPAPPTPQSLTSSTVGQFYFTDMGIPAQLVSPQTQPRLPQASPGLTIVEANGWYLTHPQFANFSPGNHLNNTLQVVTYGSKPFDASQLPVNIGRLEHGTQVLGMLIANNTDPDSSATPPADLCRGILPQSNVTIRLVSCLTGDSVLSNGLLRPVFNEAAAMLAAIVATPPGEVILIELGTSDAKFPLDVQPAIYDMLTYADYLDITVVEAAGNGGALLDFPAPGQPPLLPPRDLTKPGNDRTESYWSMYLDNDAGRAQLQQLVRQYVGQGSFAAAGGGRFRSVKTFLNQYNQTPSPAILVGAAFRNPSGQFNLLPNSSRGGRVKVFAQGNGILTTTSPGFVGNTTQFVGSMSDTSGAAAIIAGVVALLQGEARKKGLPPLAPSEIAEWLVQPSGTSVTMPAGLSATGVVPSCQAVFNHLDSI